MTNRITVYGHLGKDAEVKDVNGKRVLELSVASSHKIKGEDITVWRRATFWGDNYRNMEPYLKKGSGVRVYGEEMPPSIYEGKVQLTMVGKDIMFNSTGKGSDKKDGDSWNKFTAKPKQEGQRLPGLAPC